MKRFWTVSALGSLLAVGGFAESLSGTISDAMCAAKHADASASDAACVKRCIGRGSAPVLVSDGKVYKISADSAGKTKDFLGMKVTVDGKVDGDTVTIESISAPKT